MVGHAVFAPKKFNMTDAILDFSIPDFQNIIRDNTSFVLTTHIKPDGDALGSEMAFAEWLLSLGKQVKIYNHSETPSNYYFLDRNTPIIEVFDAAKHSEIIRSSDVFFLLDTNDPARAKSLEKPLSEHKFPVLIDHHLHPKDFAKFRFVDTEATSTGEMIYRLITASIPTLGGTISQIAAQALYVAIMTDTGSFRFPRTTSETFRIAADLIDKGADPVVAYDKTYNTTKPSRLLLIGRALSSIEYHFDSRLAIQTITQKDIAESGATEEEVDGFVQSPLQIGSVVFSIFILELAVGWKVSFRSKGDKSAADLSQAFGGNGHFHAAGARLMDAQTLETLKTEIIAAASKQLS